MARGGSMESRAEWYRVLGVTPGATPEQLKRAYRRLAKRWHPDLVANDPAARRVAEERMKRLNAAYGALRSPGASRQEGSGPSRGGPQQPPPRREPGDQQKRDGQSAKPSDPPRPGARASARRYRIPTGAVIMAVLALGRINSSGFFDKWVGSVALSGALAQRPASPGSCFSVGSTKAEVRAVQGSPDKSSDGTWSYGTSHVYFLFDRVVIWHSDPSIFLKVSLTPCDVRATD